MKISLITPSYNSAATIQDTIDCILGQSYPNVEYIIVDGQSKDETVSIIQSYGGKISKWVSESDKGLYDAMNKGISMATGDVVGILNSDDFYSHDKVLEKVVQAFEQHQVDVVYGDLQYVHEVDTKRIVRYWKSGKYRRQNFLYGWMPPHPTFFVKREFYEKFGLFDLSFRSAADYELMLRFLYKHQLKAHYIPEVLVKMRAGGVSNASWKHRFRANKEDRRAWQRNGLKPTFFTTWLKPIRKLTQFRTLG